MYSTLQNEQDSKGMRYLKILVFNDFGVCHFKNLLFHVPRNNCGAQKIVFTSFGLKKRIKIVFFDVWLSKFTAAAHEVVFVIKYAVLHTLAVIEGKIQNYSCRLNNSFQT